MEGLTESVRKYLFHIQGEVKENGRSHRICKKVPVSYSSRSKGEWKVSQNL